MGKHAAVPFLASNPRPKAALRASLGVVLDLQICSPLKGK